MKKDKSKEKQFLEYLDRLLAGEDIRPGEEASHEVRSALEHARRMLAFREEPSLAFKAELKNKLLRQLAEKQAPAARRERFGERMANIFPPRSVLIAVTSTAVLVLLAFIGVVWFAGRQAAAPSMPAMAPPSAVEYSVTLPANIVPVGVTFTAKTPLSTRDGEAAIYEIDTSDVTVDSVIELGRRLGFTGDAKLSDDGTKIFMSDGEGVDMRQLTVWTASGAVEYGYVEPEKLYPPYPPELPSQSQAELIAYDFLQQADLLPSDYRNLAGIEDETTVAAGGGYSVSKEYAAEAPPAAPSAPTIVTGAQVPTYWQVDFPYFIDGSEATGPGSKIEVSVGDQGEVLRILWSWRPVTVLSTDLIISEQQAFQDLTQGKGSLEVPLDCRQVVVEDVQLKYWLDPPSKMQDYTVPVYEFTGKCLDKNGRTLESFTGWAPALHTN
jgi:hypothetical protein